MSTVDTVIRIITMIEFFALWAGFGTFTFGYVWLTGGLRHGGWRASEPGRLVAALSASCFWVLTLGVLQLLWPDYPARTAVRLISYGLLILVVWWLVSLLVRRQRERRRERSSS